MTKQKFSPSTVRGRRASLRTKALRVLVVENHSDTREGIQLFLKALGYHAAPTASMQEALSLASHGTFDVLISDLTLPDGNGWDLIGTLRERGQEPRHSVAMSGLSGASDQARSRAAGYKAHLVKPFSPQQLEKVLHEVADDLAPLMIATAPQKNRTAGLRQQLHDGLCQHLAASALLQSSLVNRLESLGKTSVATLMSTRQHDSANHLPFAFAEAIDEARRIGQLIHEALDQTRVLMNELER